MLQGEARGDIIANIPKALRNSVLRDGAPESTGV